MKLRKGSIYSWADIEQDEHGFKLTQRMRVGSQTKQLGKVKRCAREEDLLLELSRRIDERLAQIGREKIKP